LSSRPATGVNLATLDGEIKAKIGAEDLSNDTKRLQYLALMGQALANYPEIRDCYSAALREQVEENERSGCV
jgi:hypothetical protein